MIGRLTRTKAQRAAAALLLCWGLISPPVSAQSQRPVYEVFRTVASIQVDGRLNEAVWGMAPVFSLRDNLTGAPTELKTHAWAVFDHHFLYFAFQVWDENIWSTMTRRDEHLWTEEVVEVFLQADRSHPSYLELEVNPLGAMLDIFLIDIRKPIPYSSWNSRLLKWAVRVEGSIDGEAGDHFWTCEIALPLEDIVTAPHLPPRVGDRWGLNLYRVEQLPDKAGLAWAPTLKPDFHVPSRFGEIVFSERTLP